MGFYSVVCPLRVDEDHPGVGEIFWRGCAGGWLDQSCFPEEMLAVWAGDGGCRWWVACPSLPGLPAFLSCSGSFGLMCSCPLVDSQTPLASVTSWVLLVSGLKSQAFRDTYYCTKIINQAEKPASPPPLPSFRNVLFLVLLEEEWVQQQYQMALRPHHGIQQPKYLQCQTLHSSTDHLFQWNNSRANDTSSPTAVDHKNRKSMN